MKRRLCELRDRRGKTQSEIAERLNCSQACYSFYETGKSDLPTDVLFELALFLRASADYILGVTGEEKPYRRSSRRMKNLYKRLRDLREDSDKKQRELAEYLGCSQVAYSYYELGRRDAPPEVLVRLAEYYGTSVDYLLGLTDEKKPYPRAE